MLSKPKIKNLIRNLFFTKLFFYRVILILVFGISVTLNAQSSASVDGITLSGGAMIIDVAADSTLINEEKVADALAEKKIKTPLIHKRKPVESGIVKKETRKKFKVNTATELYSDFKPDSSFNHQQGTGINAVNFLVKYWFFGDINRYVVSLAMKEVLPSKKNYASYVSLGINSSFTVRPPPFVVFSNKNEMKKNYKFQL